MRPFLSADAVRRVDSVIVLRVRGLCATSWDLLIVLFSVRLIYHLDRGEECSRKHGNAGQERGNCHMNDLHIVDLSIIIVYLVMTLAVGIYAGRRIRDLEDFAVAGRSYPAWIIFATLAASFIGGGFTMGNAQKVYVIGMVNVAALWGFSLKELLVARYIAPRVQHFPSVISVGDIMEKDYGLPAKVITGIFSLFLCAGILGAQVAGIGTIFKQFLGMSDIWGILIGTGIVILYSAIGGMKSVVATDILQFCILAVGVPLALLFGIFKAGGLKAVIDAAPAGHFSLFSHMTPVAFLSLFLTFVLGETLVPPYVIRLFIGKDHKQAARGTMLSGLFSIPFFAISGMIGLVALAMNPNLDNPNLAMPYVIHQALPVGLCGLVVAGIVAVVMSSADSFLNTASMAVVNDIIAPFTPGGLSKKASLSLARWTTLLTGALAIIFAVKIKGILDILIYAYNFWAPIILPPLVFTLLGLRPRPMAFYGGAFGGLAGVLLWNNLFGLTDKTGFDGLVAGVFVNVAVFLAIHFMGGAREEKA